MPKIRPLHYVLGVAGIALTRSWLRGEESAAPHVQELARLVAELDRSPLNVALDMPEMDVASGYADWASTYDDLANPLISVEEPVVHGLIDRLPASRALDAACGTGRHAQYLRSQGHQVVAVDVSPEMLGKARAKVPGAGFCLGSLSHLPLATASFDLVVCSLALDHSDDISGPIAELARVVRPGGWAIMSDIHPVNTLLGGGAIFQGADRRFRIVRSFYHDHAEYVSAFLSAGFEIRECVEPRCGEREMAMMPGGVTAAAPDAFRAAMLGTPMALVWLLARR